MIKEKNSPGDELPKKDLMLVITAFKHRLKMVQVF
jgi:hypothetical protein